MSQQVDVMVVGGGIVGLTAALAMSQRGFFVAIMDAGKFSVDTQKPDLRRYAINPASQRLFEQLGAWEKLDKTRISPYQHMHIWDAMNGAHIDFDARQISSDHLGTILEESIIKEALLNQIALQTNISLFPNSKITALQHAPDKISARSGKTVWDGQLLIVADGAMSPTRELLNVPLTVWPYHQQAIVATVETEKTHLCTAYQVFNSDGPLAFLPLADPNQCSIVWSTTPKRAEKLMALSDKAFNEALAEAFGKKLGHVKVLSKRFQFPLLMRHVQRYQGSKWLLMGDAAHTIHPLAGLGLNLGLADIVAWLDILDKNKNAAWSKKALGAYQRQRKHAVWQIIALMEALKTVFANPLPPFVHLRGIGLQALNNLPLLQRMLIQYAAAV